MMKRILAIVSCALLLVITATGCNSKDNDMENSKGAKTITIGISMPQIDEITQNLCGSYEAYAETLGGVELIFTDAGGNSKQQSEDIESLISQNCDIIVVRAVDGNDIANACDAVMNANIPLVIDETPVATTNYSVSILENQSVHGRLHGEYLQGLLDKGEINEVKIGYIAGTSDDDMLKRMAGITEACTSAEFIAVGEEGYALANNWSAEGTQEIVKGWISSGLIDDMNVIVCMNEALANATVAALGDEYPDMIVLGAGSKNPLVYQNIENGKIKAATSQDGIVFVNRVLDVCMDLANGVEIKFDDPENKIIYPQNISLLTTDTIAQE